jgi:predicted GIY-YIG superfamily endonuclease
MRIGGNTKTRAGLFWDRDWRLVPTKLVIGAEAQAWFTKRGSDGWFTKTNQKRMVELVGDRLPDVLADIRREYDGNQPIGGLLARRAAHCVTGDLYRYGYDEVRRFHDEAIFSPTVNAALGTEKLTYIRLMQLQQERTRILFKDQLGVYLRWNIEMPNYIYVGISKDMAARQSGHTNQPFYLFTAFATANLKDAQNIEDAAHAYLREIGGVDAQGGRGVFRLPPHTNALVLTEAYLIKQYSGWFKSIGEGTVT